MKKYIRFSLTGLWVLFATFFLAGWWLRHPDSFPQFSDGFWMWLHDLFGVEGAQAAEDIGILVTLIWAFCFVSFATWLGLFLHRRIKNH
jgi:hypothetical protein